VVFTYYRLYFLLISTMNRIGIFGSAFNPPSLGHLDLIKQSVQAFDKVYLVPSFCHPLGKEMLSYPTRCHLVSEFLHDINQPNCQLLMIEHLLASKKPIYTYDLLVFLTRFFVNDEVSFIIGPDNANPETWKKFYRYQDIEKNWNIFVGKQNIDTRSTQIRHKISQQQDFSELTTTSVYQWIQFMNLYQTPVNSD